MYVMLTFDSSLQKDTFFRGPFWSNDCALEGEDCRGFGGLDGNGKEDRKREVVERELSSRLEGGSWWKSMLCVIVMSNEIGV